MSGMKFDEKGRYIPMNERFPKVEKVKRTRTVRREVKKEPKQEGATFGISYPTWTSASSKFLRDYERKLNTPNYSGEKLYPQSIPDSSMKKLQEQGWVQIGYGREFIERSYALAKEFKDLWHKGINNYDCASPDYYKDTQLNIYWRETGSFD